MGNMADQMDFGWPNAEIGRKMANGQLLFLALVLYCVVGAEWNNVHLRKLTCGPLA